MVCNALSRVVVDTCWECCAAERRPVGVEEPDMVDKRWEGSMADYRRRVRLREIFICHEAFSPCGFGVSPPPILRCEGGISFDAFGEKLAVSSTERMTVFG